MSWIRCIALGFIAALYMLAGRWGFDRLLLSEPNEFLELRLWIVMGGAMLAAVGLAVSEGASGSDAARKRAIARMVREIADYLGNTPPSPGPRISTRASSNSTRTVRRSLPCLAISPPGAVPRRQS